MAARIGTLGSLKIRLANWVEPGTRYRRQYVPVDPESEVVSGEVPGLVGQPSFRPWRVRSWRGGEGSTWWDPRQANRYRQSTNVRPVSIGDGLEIGARQIVTLAQGGSTFNDSSRFGYGLGKLWTVDDGDGYPWDVSNEEWDPTVSTGATSSPVTSLSDGDDTYMYSGHESGAIWRWKSGTATEHFDTTTDPFTYAPVLRSFAGQLYALDGDDLYVIDKTTADTRTIKGDLSGSSAVYLAETPWAYGRMSLSDKGPIWVRRLDNGQTLLELYNPSLDEQETLGKLAVDFAFPYSVFHTHGFTFVAFRYAPSHSEKGDAYLWIKRGAQESYAGPFRSLTGATASKPVLIAGVIGDDIVCYFDGAVWAYNLSDGGINQLAKQTTTGTPEDAVTFGKDVFIGPVTSGANSKAVERFDTTRYSLATASIDLGKIDFDYPGMGKVLLDVTVVTDPLPANTSLQVAVSTDGGSFSTLSGTHSTDGATKYTFTASSSGGSTLYGQEFEIRLLPLTTDEDATVTVREVTARATGADHVLEIVMVLDAGPIGDQASHVLIDGLNALGEPSSDPVVVSFSDPFQNEEKESPDTFDVTVEDVITPEVAGGHVSPTPTATVRLRATSLR